MNDYNKNHELLLWMMTEQTYNMQGIEVYEKNIPITTIGTQSINIPLSNIIPSGNYIVNLSVDDQVYKKTIIIR